MFSTEMETQGCSDMNRSESEELPISKLPKNVEKEINLQKMREKLYKLKADVLTNFEQQISEKLENFLHDVEQIESSSLSNGNVPSKSRKKNGELSAKIYAARPSVLSELLEINHIKSIYHIFVAILIVFMLNTFAFDVLDKGRVELDFSLIMYSFGKFPLVLTVWLCMMLGTSVVVYIAFQSWACNRKQGRRLGWFDYLWIGLYLAYQAAFFYLPVRTILQHGIPTASSVVILTEQVRLVMKTHAFLRENVVRALNYNGKKDEVLCPDFSKYLYFLFAPTLIYRDNYPRNSGPIRWNYVLSNFLQVLACVFYMYYIFERFCISIFKNFNEQFMTLRYFSVSVFSCMLPGTLVLFITFFAILHSWLNAFAEMLRFSDRLFYKDWWNSTSFSNYYRTWNVVVHDWLYTYIYQDLQRVFGTSCRAFMMAFVFLLSAVVHEYILSVTFGFVYPVLFFMFAGAGFAFIFLPNNSQRSGNVFLWVALFIGNGLLMCLYCMEWYARIRCPRYVDNYLDYFVPRSWNCNLNSTHGTNSPSYFSNPHRVEL